MMNYRDVACPNCGTVYAVGYSDVPHSVENIHRICDTCMMPIEVKNPWNEKENEAMTKNKVEKMDEATKESVMEATVVVHKEVREMSWDAFRATGLLTFINGFLHIFGWSICVEYKDGTFIRAYPMRTPWRGFKEETWTTAYGKIADYMAENADKIKEETKNG